MSTPDSQSSTGVADLVRRGVEIPHPASVHVDASVNPDRIAPGVTLHPGTRLSGETLSIGTGSEIGKETPATVENCQVGRHVSLAGGFFSGSVFLDHVSIGSAAHIRPACLLEESATCGHAVGLKQTLLLPFVTTGSLVNFCDCAMAGGTSRSNHGEVGSSYIHFNFSPGQDKATASLIGDIPRGVMLNQAPVFLGGQGGLVGPARIAYGTVVAAGSIVRKDIVEPDLLHALPHPQIKTPFLPGRAPNHKRKLRNNVLYIANLAALERWYARVREPWMSRDAGGDACCTGAREVLRAMRAERIRRVDQWLDILTGNADSPLAAEKTVQAWDRVRTHLDESRSPGEDPEQEDAFLSAFAREEQAHENFTDAIKALSAETRQLGTRWLQSLVDGIDQLIT